MVPESGDQFLTAQKLEEVKNIIEKPEEKWRVLWHQPRLAESPPSPCGSSRSFSSSKGSWNNRTSIQVTTADENRNLLEHLPYIRPQSFNSLKGRSDYNDSAATTDWSSVLHLIGIFLFLLNCTVLVAGCSRIAVAWTSLKRCLWDRRLRLFRHFKRNEIIRMIVKSTLHTGRSWRKRPPQDGQGLLGPPLESHLAPAHRQLRRHEVTNFGQKYLQ